MTQNKLIAPNGFKYKVISETEIELVPITINKNLDFLDILNGNNFFKFNI